MAAALAEAGLDAVYSYAGRTAAPVAAPLPTRIGGFGGAAGLATWLRDNGIGHVIDATHPFAAQISRNALAACQETGVALIALERPAWVAQDGDRWTSVGDIALAAAALPVAPATVFLAIGRQNLEAFRARPAHRYVLRLVDAPAAPPLPGAVVVVDRGPFTEAGDIALMQRHGVQLVVAKNAGGSGASAKLGAARALGLPVIMVDRPALPDRHAVGTVAEVMAWLHDAKRGV